MFLHVYDDTDIDDAGGSNGHENRQCSGWLPKLGAGGLVGKKQSGAGGWFSWREKEPKKSPNGAASTFPDAVWRSTCQEPRNYTPLVRGITKKLASLG